MKLGMYLDHLIRAPRTQTQMILLGRSNGVESLTLNEGIDDQQALSQLRVLVSGSANGIADALVLLDQIGVSSMNGTIGIHSEETEPRQRLLVSRI